jgi:hypothetical protein
LPHVGYQRTVSLLYAAWPAFFWDKCLRRALLDSPCDRYRHGNLLFERAYSGGLPAEALCSAIFRDLFAFCRCVVHRFGF